jgi:hypothetical protein
MPSVLVLFSTNISPAEVKSRAYPASEHTYLMPAEAMAELDKLINTEAA